MHRVHKFSGDDFADGMAEVLFEELVARDFQFMWIDAHEVIDRGVNIGHVVGIFYGVVAQLVGFTITNASLDASTRQPSGEGACVVVAA